MATISPEKRREYNARYRAKHPERLIASRKKYYVENKEAVVERNLAYRKAHPDVGRAVSKRWRKAHPEKVREMKLLYGPRYAEHKREYDKKYRSENREKLNSLKLARWHMKRSAEGSFTPEDITALLESQSGRCANTACRKSLKRHGYHIDHVIPLSKGGSNWPTNLQLLCPTCNLKKSDKDPERWAAENGLLFC